MTTAADITAAYPKAAPVAQEIIKLARWLETEPAYLANVMNFESGFNPQAINPYSGASGLIQFVKPTAEGLGTSLDALRAMTGVQQMPWVKKYFSRFRGKLKTQGDVYLAVFYPARIGKDPTIPFSAKVQSQNPGIKNPGDYIAKANAKARLPTGPGVALSNLPSVSALPSGQRDLRQRVRRKKQKQQFIQSQRRWSIGAGAIGLLVVVLYAAMTARKR